ncbi:MAG: hypothetical protein K2I74_04155, partial [Treponemataceae bacterium]|nr:hypothetical protein [Treponemataceae bacterium]
MAQYAFAAENVGGAGHHYAVAARLLVERGEKRLRAAQFRKSVGGVYAPGGLPFFARLKQHGFYLRE